MGPRPRSGSVGGKVKFIRRQPRRQAARGEGACGRTQLCRSVRRQLSRHCVRPAQIPAALHRGVAAPLPLHRDAAAVRACEWHASLAPQFSPGTARLHLEMQHCARRSPGASPSLRRRHAARARPRAARSAVSRCRVWPGRWTAPGVPAEGAEGKSGRRGGDTLAPRSELAKLSLMHACLQLVHFGPGRASRGR